MATIRKTTAAPLPPAPLTEDEPFFLWRAFDATFRFLASLKLAVLSLTTLSATLAYATFFESEYGTGAVQDYIYRGPFFKILLAFMASNILCAALIRFPWKKRQTGFVITHAGLLTVLAGSLLSILGIPGLIPAADEGQVGMLEGKTSRQLVRLEHPVIRVQKLDEQTHRPESEYSYPFYAGSFPWQPGHEETVTGPGRSLAERIAGAFGFPQPAKAVDEKGIQLVARKHIPASTPPMKAFGPDPSGKGIPMLKLAALAQPPGAPAANDVLAEDDGGWFAVEEPRVGSVSKDVFPALFRVQYADAEDSAARLDDFMTLPPKPGEQDLVRLHYKDKQGRPRVYDWVVDPAGTAPIALPESDLTATFVKVESKAMPAFARYTGDTDIHTVTFKVKSGSGPEVEHTGYDMMPGIPNILPKPDAPAPRELLHVSYFHHPELGGGGMRGRFGVLDLLGTADGKVYYRAFSRDGLKGKGPVKLGEAIPVFGGGKIPMSVAFRVDAFHPSGRIDKVCKPYPMAKNQLDKGIPAVELEMTVNGHKETFWARRSSDLEPRFQDVEFPDAHYRVAYDFDRKDLGFEFQLEDFDVGMDPGTNQPSSFTSKVLLTDDARKISKKQHTITMNEPLTHGGYTFYQSNYIPVTDEQGRKTGQFMSVFSVHYDPAWQVIYLGCLGVVMGTFVQFYMRAGVFTDGGKRERATLAKRRGEAPPVEAERPDVPDSL